LYILITYITYLSSLGTKLLLEILLSYNFNRKTASQT